MCGEKGATRLNAARPVGSPPRVRGKARSAARSLISTGITPACAGKRACRCRSRRDTRDHPRVCGEKSRCPAQSPARRGSPPRVRGKVRSSAVYCTPPRITPACAGKRTTGWNFRIRKRDHPRVCGEKHSLSFFIYALTGSPPRVRGKAVFGGGVGLDDGITPACAGKSVYEAIFQQLWRDHPRVCGEKPYSSLPYTAPSGSPPRVRGKGIAATCVSRSPGITPACAGKRSPSTTQRSSHGDHPRVCGEKTTICCCCATPLGSPPRVRGKDGAPADVIAGFGITPACAGKRSRPG